MHREIKICKEFLINAGNGNQIGSTHKISPNVIRSWCIFFFFIFVHSVRWRYEDTFCRISMAELAGDR